MTAIPSKIYHGCKKPETGGDCRPGNLQPDGIHHKKTTGFLKFMEEAKKRMRPSLFAKQKNTTGH
jgi:hypothetical protein